MTADVVKPVSTSKYKLDDVLRAIGCFGRYQICVFVLICIGAGYANIFSVTFVFSAGDVKYRCRIVECESDGVRHDYQPKWLESAIPFKNNLPKSCTRYKFRNISSNDCTASDNFDHSIEEDCSDLIFDDYEKTIVEKFNLTCDDNWKVAMVGTIHYIGHFLNLMVSGIFSDKFGRKIVFIFSTIAGGIFPIIRSFSWNYVSFVTLEFIDAFLVAGVYSAGYILALEILSPELRAFGGALVFCSSSILNGFLGLFAWWLLDWQLLLRVTCSPAIILGVIFIFTIPESYRWLLSKGRNEEVAEHLLKAAIFNKIQLTDNLSQTLTTKPQNIILETEDDNQDQHEENNYSNDYNIKEIFQYPKFCLRIAICAYCWLTNIFVFYGLSLTAVAIGGNKFSDYTIVSFIEVPAIFFVIYAADRIGRRYLLIGALFSSGISLFASAFIPHIYWLNLTLFLIGKFSITVSFSTIYTFTSEIFPTNYRHTLLGFCSGFGRIGSMIATQATFLQTFHRNVPTFLFAGTAIISGLLSFTFPETLNTRLPDTIQEAMHIGQKKCDQKRQDIAL